MPPPSDIPPPRTALRETADASRRTSQADDLERQAARQRELMAAASAAEASLVAIKASRTYRLTLAYRRAIRRQPLADAAAIAHPPAVVGLHDSPLDLERARTAALEARLRQVEHQIQVASQSGFRRVWLGARRRLGALLTLIAHPFWTTAAAWRLLSHRGLVGGIRSAWRRVRWNGALCRFMPAIEQQVDASDTAEALRWLPPMRISGETQAALFAHPPTSIAYQLQPPGGSRVVASCSLAPQVWNGNCGGVMFELTVEIPGRQWSARRTRLMDPGGRRIDRRWRRLVVDLPEDTTGDVVVRLTTTLPEGVDPGHAWAVWGEPRVEWRRTREQTWRAVLGLVGRVRQAGLLGALRQIRELQSSDEEAERYRRWVAIHTPDAAAAERLAAEGRSFASQPRVSVITPVYNTEARWLRAAVESVRRQIYPHWELCLADDGSTSKDTLKVLKEYEQAGDPRIRIVHLARNAGISGASNAALELASGEFVALLDHDDELAPEALLEMVRRLNEVPDADLVYSDEDKLDSAGERCDAYFKPDWSPEHFRSCMYTCHLMMLRTSLVREIDGFRLGVEGSQDYDLVLRVIERTSRIEHVAKILYHWRKIEGSVAASGQAKTWAIDAGERALQDHVARTGLDAVVLPGAAPGLYRIRHRIAGSPLVSIVIPTDGRSREIRGRPVDLLVNCVKSILRKTTYENFEIVIADNGQLPEPAVDFLETVPHTRVHYGEPGPFNYARKLNYAVGHSRGSQLVLFNDDIEIITPEWIEAMLEYAQQDSIGAVGAKLLYPDGRLQHIGVVMGVCGMAAHAFHSHPGTIAGYGSSALIVRNYSAVTAACMMTRRSLYERLDGFDERFAFDFNDTDYCLRLRREGYRIVYTPHAELYHLESATFGARTWSSPDLRTMQQAWSDVCERDPYYNPHLTRDFPDYRVRV